MSLIDVLEAHVAFAARVQLQGDMAVYRLGRGIREVQYLDPIQDRDHVVALDLDEHVVPVGRAEHLFVFRCGPGNPLTAIAVQAAVVVVDGPIDFELQALSDVRAVGCEFGVEVDPAVAVGLALEAYREPEVFVLLLGSQVAVGTCDALAVNGAVFHRPFFLADLDPVGQILAVEQTYPLLTGMQRAVGGHLRVNQ
jgi:hypothetical protein